jgi:hypothetical protein
MAAARQFSAAALPHGIADGDGDRVDSGWWHRVVAAAWRRRQMGGAVGKVQALDRLITIESDLAAIAIVCRLAMPERIMFAAIDGRGDGDCDGGKTKFYPSSR